METLYHWKFNQELIDTLKKSIEKGNTTPTTLNKAKNVLRKYDELILNSTNSESIGKSYKKILEDKSKALEFMKSGFIRIPGYMHSIKLSTIESYSAKGGDNPTTHIEHNGTTTICDQKAFDILKEIFE